MSVLIKQNQSCETCLYWGKLRAKGIGEDVDSGCWPDEKPARSCVRFPPNGLWGATKNAREFGIGSHLKTFCDDWCAEWKTKEA